MDFVVDEIFDFYPEFISRQARVNDDEWEISVAPAIHRLTLKQITDILNEDLS